jgi:RNA polymerase sigma-70 factor (ECF subfamily)
LELFTFDKSYVDRLRDGDPLTEQHFASYFGQLLDIMLRARRLPPEQAADVRQETLSRVIAVLRRENGIRQPEHFGAFVCSVCKNVLRENLRHLNKTEPLQQVHLDLPAPDKIVDIERNLISEEIKTKVRKILSDMKQRDRHLLEALFLEERNKDDLCSQFGVDRQYLRVLLYRAKERLRSSFQDKLEKCAQNEATGKIEVKRIRLRPH